MEIFRMDGVAGQPFEIRVEELQDVTADHVRTLIEIDLQTFAESTFSPYTAAVFLQNGRVFLLRADDLVIGTCVCVRCWDRPAEVTILSVGIRPGWRGRGLGQHFVRAVLAGLHGTGLRGVSLLVGSENRRALKVYEDVGFERAGVGPTDPHQPGELVLMRIQL